MMTPKEKAVDIFYKYFEATNNHYIAKECALILVDEMIKVFNPENWGLEMDNAFEGLNYWLEVKQEIEKL